MPVKDIKKAGQRSQLQRGSGERVPQLASAGEEADAQEGIVATEPSRTGSGRVAIYARVSSEAQEKDGTIASQIAAIETYAQQHEMKLKDDDIYVDEGYSGRILRRPGLDRLLDGVYEGRYEHVLIMNPFRLARNYGHQILLLEEFQRGDCQVIFIQRPIGETPDDNLLLQIQGVVAEYEHAKIQERTRRGKMYRMRQGELMSGQRVFGYNYIKRKNDIPAHHEINESEAEVVRNIYHWHLYDGLSLRAIASRLQEAVVATVRGGRWKGAHIGRMLGNTLYIGTGYANKLEAVEPQNRRSHQAYRKHLKTSLRKRPREEWLPFLAPSLVDEETFELVQQRLQRNRELASRNTKHDYLLRGLVQCDGCKRAMHANTTGKCYWCSYTQPSHANDHGLDPCKNTSRIPISELDELVWQEVVKLLKKPATLKTHYPNLRNKISPRATGGSPEKLDLKIDEVQKQIKRTNNLFIRGILDQSSHDTKYRELDEKFKRLKIQRERAAAEHMDQEEADELLRSFASFAKTIESRLGTADFTMRRNIVEQIVKRVIVGKSVITVEHIVPCERKQLRNNLGYT
jgi:site-specific DNA recombinase